MGHHSLAPTTGVRLRFNLININCVRLRFNFEKMPNSLVVHICLPLNCILVWKPNIVTNTKVQLHIVSFNIYFENDFLEFSYSNLSNQPLLYDNMLVTQLSSRQYLAHHTNFQLFHAFHLKFHRCHSNLNFVVVACCAGKPTPWTRECAQGMQGWR